MSSTTSDKRREVAEELRNYMRLRSSDTFEAFYTRLNGILFGDDGFDRPDSDVFERLADLIDPTCHLVSTTFHSWSDGLAAFYHELSCGHICETVWGKPPLYCPECGARLVDDDDDY